MLQQLNETANRTRTENGALAHRSTGSHCLNFFAVCGALRSAEPDAARRLFARAWAENRDLALRTLFYARDVRGGLGERQIFRDLIAFLARRRPVSVTKNLAFIPEFGRWDDLLALLNTPCEPDAAALIRTQLDQDLRALESDGAVSLLAKWLPSINTSSPKRRAQARRLCRLLKIPEKDYRRMLARLRAQIDVLETRLCRTDYTFDYAKQPGGAMLKYRQAFQRHDPDRYAAYIERVREGRARMHADNLYPSEIVRPCLAEVNDFRLADDYAPESSLSPEMIAALDAAWKSLPDYGDARNALAVVDGSASMYWGGSPLPAEVAISLAIYFAEHNRGHFHDHFITFSRTPRLVRLEGDNIADRASYCASFNECANTNLRATFTLLLNTALENHLPQSDLPETLYIISDMEFDEGADPDATLFEETKALYAAQGYRLPTLVYWNVQSRNEQFPVRQDDKGTVLVSGASPSLFKMVAGQNISPIQFMLDTLGSERYAQISA